MRRLILLCLFVIGLYFALSSFRGLATQGEYESIVLDFQEGVSTTEMAAQVNGIAQQYKVTPKLNSEFSALDHIYVIEGDRHTLKQLKKSSVTKYTEYIEPNFIYRISKVPNDPDYSKQWNLRSINLEAAWDETKGSGTTVAVIDTGISRVPDLQNTQFVQGYDFVSDRAEAEDDNGHGTHVAGTIAQSTNNNYGVAGVAYEASLMPLKVLNEYGGEQFLTLLRQLSLLLTMVQMSLI